MLLQKPMMLSPTNKTACIISSVTLDRPFKKTSTRFKFVFADRQTNEITRPGRCAALKELKFAGEFSRRRDMANCQRNKHTRGVRAR